MIGFPNAKINIGLYIVNKRADGFHDIESLFYPVPLFDMIEVINNPNWHVNQPKWQFQSDGLPVDGSSDQNLIVRAYQHLDTLFDLPPVSLYLYKKIPMGAGLGGGSSDAAFMLRLLNLKFDLQLDIPDLEQIASRLGSDCAFFIRNQPAYLLGKGEELQPYPVSLKGYILVLISPPYFSSTAGAYQGVKPRGSDGIQLKNQLMLPVSEWKNHIQNDFETNVFKSIPELQQYKDILYASGAVYASMSGSGTTLFGLFEQEVTFPEWVKPFVSLHTRLE